MLMRPGKRAHYVMVDEDDPQWVRFWDHYPRRCSKKEARKAWAKVNPTPELVDRMLEALTWQTARWARDDFRYTPHPSSWLNGERWTDEPPAQTQKVMSDGAALVFETLRMKP